MAKTKLDKDQLPSITEDMLPEVNIFQNIFDSFEPGTVELGPTGKIQFTGSAPGLPKPAAPTDGIVDDTANTFAVTPPTGYESAQLETSINGGSTWADNPSLNAAFVVGNVDKAIGQVITRVKAVADENQAGFGLANATAFNAESGGAELGTPVTAGSFAYGSGAFTIVDGTITRIDSGGNNDAALLWSVASGASGFVSQRFVKPWTESGEGATNTISIGDGLDPHYGDDAATYYKFRVEDNGSVHWQEQGGSEQETSAGAVLTNGIVRLRATADTVYLEYSNDEAETFTVVDSSARTSSTTIRSKINSVGNRFKCVDLRIFNG